MELFGIRSRDGSRSSKVRSKIGTSSPSRRSLALLSYLRSGLTAFETLEQVLAWRFGSIEQVQCLLDFASGYGRVTRFLVDRIPAGRVTAGEISERALAFQSAKLGTRSLQSSTLASQLLFPRKYQVVVAFSLLTHLPEQPCAPRSRHAHGLRPGSPGQSRHRKKPLPPVPR